MRRILSVLLFAVFTIGCDRGGSPAAQPISDTVEGGGVDRVVLSEADDGTAAVDSSDAAPSDAAPDVAGALPVNPDPIGAPDAEALATARMPAAVPATATRTMAPAAALPPPPGVPVDPFEDSVTLDSLAETSAQSSAQPSEPPPKPRLQPGMEERTFETVAPDNALRVSFDDFDLLKVLGVDKAIPLDVAKSFPDWLSGLDGRRVRLRGFMYPPLEPSGIRGFLLARDNQICCFGRDPLAYDILPVRLAEGETTDYIQNRPFDVVGIFHVDPLEDDLTDGILQQVYSMDEAIVIDE